MEKELIDNIIADKEFLKKVIKLNSVEEVKKAFKGRGLNFSNKDIKTIGEAVKFQIENAEKIQENMLEKISGGLWDPTFEKFKNLSVGVSAIAAALAVIFLTIDVKNISSSVDQQVTDFNKSWLWRIIKFRWR